MCCVVCDYYDNLLTDLDSQDSLVGSGLDWYSEGPGFKLYSVL